MKVRQLGVAIAAVMFVSTFFVACSDTSAPACAEEVYSVVAPSPAVLAEVARGGPSTGGGGGRSSGGSSGKSSGGSSKSSGSGSKSSGSATKSPPTAKTPTNKSSSQKAASSSSKPTAKQDPKSIAKAQATAPKTVSRTGSYTSSVTGNTYIYQGGAGNNFGYYRSPGYILDFYDPFNPYNYWLYTSSPFYGRPYMLAGSCGDKPEEVQKENIEINVNADGAVVDSKEVDPNAPTTTTAAPAPGASTTSTSEIFQYGP